MSLRLGPRFGWKLVALLCVWLYLANSILILLNPRFSGIWLYALNLLALAWLAGLVLYAFAGPLASSTRWRPVALLSAMFTIGTLGSFLGYRATRLAVIDLPPFHIGLTLAEMILGSAFAVLTMVPLLRLARLTGPRRVPLTLRRSGRR